MDTAVLFGRTLEWWLSRIDAVGTEQWSNPTPCGEWTARDLVHHVVAEDRLAVPLLGGATIEDIGDRFDGDLLGADPVSAAHAAAEEALGAARVHLPVGGLVHLSQGKEDLAEYVLQLSADHLIHGWDLAAAVGANRTMDPELVAEVADWFADREEMYRAGGAVAAHVSDSGDPQTNLLAAYGRSASWTVPG